MGFDEKIRHSIICEHTRKVATHVDTRSSDKHKKDCHAVSSKQRLKEFNRSRRMLLAKAIRLRRIVKSLPDDLKE
jgi:hypothetical protein